MKIKGKIKFLLSAVLVIAMLLSTVPAMLTASAATTSATATSTAPNTEIFSTKYFNEEDFMENFYKWNTVNSPTTFENGVLSITEHNTTRGAAYMSNVSSLNQYVSTTLDAGENVKNSAVVWLRVNQYKRPGTDEMVPIGYFVKAAKNGTQYTVTVHKSYDNDGVWANEDMLGKVAFVDATSSADGRGYCDITLDIAATYDKVSNSTAINVKVYKLNTSTGSATLMNSVTIEDNESELQVAGRVGLAACSADSAIDTVVKFTAFSYHSTDNGVAKSAYSTKYFDSKNFWDNMAGFNGNSKATLNGDGTLTIAGGSGNYRDGAQILNAANLNQTVKATVKTPHIYNEDVATYTASDAAIWLRANEITRPTGAKALYGYYVTVGYTASNGVATIRLYKQSLNDAGTDIADAKILINKSFDTKSSGSNSFNDVTIEASVTTENGIDTIDFHLYKGTYHFESLCTTGHTVEDAFVQKTGYAGLSAQSNAATFTAFSVSSSDDVASAYVEEISAKTGVLFGQVVSINPSATYQLSVLADGDFTNEPIVLSYNGCTAPLEFTPTTEGVAKDGRYNKYTYTIAPTSATVNSNTFVGTNDENVKLAPATVGFNQKDAAKYNFDLTGFELREVKADGSLGANLLVNGDFKMGFCGWSAEVSKTSFNPTTVGVADAHTSYMSRIALYRDTNNINFATKFAVENYAEFVGDANCDGELDIRDLVCIKTDASVYGDYNIYADINLDGKINAEDIVAKIKEILGKKQ